MEAGTQDALAQQMRVCCRQEGALELNCSAPRRLEGDKVVDLVQQVQNRARQLIEEVMIATNGCTARYLLRRRCLKAGGSSPGA
jgi:exoribonuclease-2